ncbi:MAG TPA: SUMF1/EgtB/PvdO family nonheme iron enzyme [Anaerolineales bacterium]
MSTFISYSRADGPFAIRLAKDLKSAGYDVWLDQLDIPTGARWDDEIESALEACTTFMIVLSPQSLQSQNVKDEIGYAIDSGKDILPVKIKSGDIPFRLRRFQYVDFSQQSYQDSLKEIKSILSTAGQIDSGRVPVGTEGQPADEKEKTLRSTPTVPARRTVDIEPSPTKPRITTPKPRLSRGLVFGIVGVVALAAAGIAIGTMQNSRDPAATPTGEVVVVQNRPTAQPTTQPTEAATDVSNQTPDERSGTFIARFLNSSELNDWEYLVRGDGKRDKIDISPSSDGLMFNLDDRDVRAYYMYEPVIYEDVVIRIQAENLGQNTNHVSLVCRRTDETWYEYRITAASLWHLFQYDGEYNRLDNGGTTAGKAGKEINEYEMHCIGNQISMYVNGQPVDTFDVINDVYAKGQVGLSVSTEDVFPIDIRIIEFEVSDATSGSNLGESTSISGTAEVADTPSSNTGSTTAGGEENMMTSPKDGMQMVYVPEGEFTMGTDNGEPDEGPPHAVLVNAFWIDRTEVTNQMFADFMNSQTDQSRISNWIDSDDEDLQVQRVDGSWQAISGYEDHPMIEVKWAGAVAYCEWRGEGTRLPTEAEWEKAARGTTDNLYAWGNDLDCSLANYGTCEGSSVKVGSSPSNASPYGALDMTGNVVEWVLDWYAEDYYQESPSSNPAGPGSGEQRVLRGGSWDERTDYEVRVTYRYTEPPDDSLDDGGFRCVQPE